MADRPTPKDVAKQVSRLANVFSDDDLKELAAELTNDHRTLQQNIMRGLIWPMLAKWSQDYEDGRYDLRNEGTVKLAHDIVSGYPEYNLPVV